MTAKRMTILLCSVAIAALTGSAAARPAHHKAIEAVAQTGTADADTRYPAATGAAPTAAAEDRGSRHSRRRMTAAEAAQSHSNSAFAGFTGNSIVEQARRYI